MATYTVWVSVDGEPYYQVLAATTQTSTLFTGEIGKTYRFYAVAADNAGNRETTPVEADATTLVAAPVTPSPAPTVTPTPLKSACAGDCDLSDTVTVDELVTGVSIALGARQIADCLPFDTSKDGAVTVDEILQAVNAALGGCAG